MCTCNSLSLPSTQPAPASPVITPLISLLPPTCSCLAHLLPPPPLPLSRLHSNNLQCDCHVAWLSEWLRQRPRLGLYTQCMAPPHLRGHNVAEVQKKEFVCTGRSGSPICFAVCFVTSLGSLFRSGKPIFCFVSSAFSHYLFAHDF